MVISPDLIVPYVPEETIVYSSIIMSCSTYPQTPLHSQAQLLHERYPFSKPSPIVT